MGYAKAKPIHCICCGAYFTAIKYFKTRNRFASINDRKVCSRECMFEWRRRDPARKAKISAAFSGDRHWNWQGGKSRLNNINNRGPGWQRQRAKALKRDGFRCIDCCVSEDDCRLKFGRGLDVDHVIPFHNFGNSRTANKLGNLASRCASCHRKAEAQRDDVQQMLPFGDSEKRRHKGYLRAERHPQAKLTNADVIEIRRRAAEGESLSSIGKAYGIFKSNASAIIRGKAWASILPANQRESV